MSYQYLANYYDRFTDDVGYTAWADYFTQAFARANLQPELVLDLACGTGSLTFELAARGYEMIGVDASPDMLMQAMNRSLDCAVRPIFLCQRMENLDLYGTIQACLCCLDSINYVTDPKILRRAFEKVSLFLEADGIFIFDVNSLHKFERMHGQSYVREDGDVFCVWQVDFDGTHCTYDFDIFTVDEQTDGKHWFRDQESHQERYYSVEFLQKLLEEAGFDRIELCGTLSFEAPAADDDRVFFIARKPSAQ